MNFEKFDVVIYKGLYGYSTSIGRKKKDSEDYDNAFIDVKFRKGVSLDNRTKISVKKSWLSFSHSDKTDKNYFFIFIDDFDVLGIIPKKDSSDDKVEQSKTEVDKIIETMDSNIGEQASIDEYLK